MQAFLDAPARNRTWNLRIKSPLLCQLSYKGAARSVERSYGVALGCAGRAGRLLLGLTRAGP